jgi:hypothetical protein
MGIARRLRALTLATAASGVLLASAGSASAATAVWWPDGWLDYYGATTAPAKHSITETSVRWLGGDLACTGAYNLDGSPAGTAYCTGSVRGHPYNGTLRYAWAGADASASYLRGRWDW